MPQPGHLTAMAGEFYVLSTLFRLGHEASLTLSNAKSIDILTKSHSGKIYQVSVKAIRAGGKWGIGTESYLDHQNLVFVFLHFNNFENPNEVPQVWVIPSSKVEEIKRPWLGETSAVYCSNATDREALAPFKNAWHEHLA